MAVVTQTRTWNNVPVRILTNTETGKIEIYATDAALKKSNPISAAFGGSPPLLASAEKNTWNVNPDFSAYYNSYNPNKLLSVDAFQKAFDAAGRKTFDNDRAYILNNPSNYPSSKIYQQKVKVFQKNGIPRIKDPTSGTITNSNGQIISDPTKKVSPIISKKTDPENPDQDIVADAQGLTLNQIPGDNRANFNQGSVEAALNAAKPKPPVPTAEQLYAQNTPNIYRYPLANLDSLSEIGIKYDFLRIRTVDHIATLNYEGLNKQLETGKTASGDIATLESLGSSAGNGFSVERYLNSQRVYDYIILPMQPNISSSNSADWGSDSMNIAQLVGGSLLSNYFGGTADKGFQDAFKQLIRDTVQQGGNLADIAVTNKSSIAALLAGSLVNANLLQRSTGTVINPNMEMLFNGPRLRTFNFQFDFTPRFDKEAQEIRKIISTLKYSMAPKRNNSAFLGTPRIFLLDYIYNGGSDGNDFSSFVRADERGAPIGNKERFKFQTHPYLNKIKPCALLDVNVNYTPDGTYMTYKSNGSMTRYSIQLQFAEIEPIYNTDFEDNGAFNPDSMGY